MQLSALRPSPAPDEDARVHRWARFLTASSDAELDQLASEDPIMSLAKQTLEALSQDPATHRLVREREEAIKLYRIDLVTSKAEGLLEGKAELLLKLLAIRFGPLPEPTRARITAATTEQIDTWAERMLTASTLDEVLAP